MSGTEQGVEQGANGTTTAEAPQGAPKIEVKVTPQKPFGAGAPKTKSQEAEILAALGSRAKDSWTVNRISAKGYPGATLGVLEVTVTADDIKEGRLHSKLGFGTYEFVNMADPKEKYVLPLGTKTPPQEFGTPAPEEQEEVFVMTQDGPTVMKVPKQGANTPRGWFQPPMSGMPSGGYWQPQGPPQTDPALKAALDMQTKLMEKMLERLDKREEGPDAKTLLELKKMEVEAAKAEAASRAAIAKTEADARVAEAKSAAEQRIAEFKAKSDADREAAKATATIQADAAKAVAAAQAEQAKAFAAAQERAATAQLEAAKANASAIVEAAKAKSSSENGMFERLLKMQEDRGAAPPPPTLIEQLGEIEQIKKLLAPPSTSAVVDGIGAAKDAAVSIIANLIALRNTQVKYVMVDAAGNPVAPPAAAPQVEAKMIPQQAPAATAANPPAGATMPPAAAAALLSGTAGAPPAPNAKPATPEDAAVVEETKALARQVMDGLSSLVDGAKRQIDPATMARAIREKLPRVYAWLRETTPDKILGEIQTMIDQPAFSEAERRAAISYRTALAGDLVWLLLVLEAVKAS